jgi:hypothetical protein
MHKNVLRHVFYKQAIAVRWFELGGDRFTLIFWE